MVELQLKKQQQIQNRAIIPPTVDRGEGVVLDLNAPDPILNSKEDK